MFSLIAAKNTFYCWHGEAEVYTLMSAYVMVSKLMWIINQSEHGLCQTGLCRKILILSTYVGHAKNFKSSLLHVVRMHLPSEVEAEAVAAAHGVSEPDVDVYAATTLTARDYTEVLSKLNIAIDRCIFEQGISNPQVVSQCGECLYSRIFYANADANFCCTKTNTTLGTPFITNLYMQAWRAKRMAWAFPAEHRHPGCG